MSLLCIFCRARTLDASTRSEHVIACAIGGRLQRRNLVCNDCNERLGREADGPLAVALERPRHWLLVRGGDGADPPTLRNVPYSGGLYNLPPYGAPVRVEKPIEQFEQKGPATTFTLKGADQEKLAELAAHMLRRAKVDANDPTGVIRVSGRRSFQPLGQHTFGPFGFADFRGIAKAAFEFFAIYFRAEALDDRFDGVREFSLLGRQNGCTQTDYANHPALPFQQEDLGAAHHSIIVWGHRDEPAIGAVTLFGGFKFTVTLCDQWWGRSFGFAHAVDPLGERIVGTSEFSPPAALTREALEARFFDERSIEAAATNMTLVCREREDAELASRGFVAGELVESIDEGEMVAAMKDAFERLGSRKK